MKNKIFRQIDKEGRFTIPKVLMDFVGLSTGTCIAFITIGEDMISFIPFEKAKDVLIIHKCHIDSKNRVIIPREFREGIKQVEVFIYEGKITIR